MDITSSYIGGTTGKKMVTLDRVHQNLLLEYNIEVYIVDRDAGCSKLLS